MKMSVLLSLAAVIATSSPADSLISFAHPSHGYEPRLTVRSPRLSVRHRTWIVSSSGMYVTCTERNEVPTNRSQWISTEPENCPLVVRIESLDEHERVSFAVVVGDVAVDRLDEAPVDLACGPALVGL